MRRRRRVGQAAGPRAVLITATTVEPRTLEIYEQVVGSLENVMDPKISAEVAGRVTRVLGFTGKKSETTAPLAIAVIGGMITSTLLTLVVVPSAYSLVESWRERRRTAVAAGAGALHAPQALKENH
jgi:hypothetical protein